MKPILISILAAVVLGGVSWFIIDRPPAKHAKYVDVLEATASVEDVDRAAAHTAVDANTGSLQRGDQLILMPITSDAITEAVGRVLRLRISHRRKAYDADLKQARASVKAMLDQMREDAVKRPYKHTDLLGTVRLAAEERNASDPTEVFVLTLLTDFIHDMPDLNFIMAPQLANEDSARKFARQLIEGREKAWTGAHVFLGQLRSKDLKRVNPTRRGAIRAFWIEYFKAGGAAEVVFATDGVGQLPDFMSRNGR